MKRLTVLILAVLLLLCSCAAQPEPVATTPPVESIPVTEPVSIYDADSKIETETDGAIKAYPLNLSDAVAMIPVGSDFLLFSGENTTLTKFTGETLRVCDTAALDCSVSPSDPAVQDGKIITSRGAGTALDFALALIAHTQSPQKAQEIKESIVY